MTVKPIVSIEIELSGSGAGWTDISPDVTGTTYGEYGIRSNRFLDRVGSTGLLSFYLRNDPGNSGGLLGYYSPNHANLRPGFALNIRARVKFAYSGSVFYRNLGRVQDIAPETGKFGPRRTRVMVTDWFEDAARNRTLAQWPTLVNTPPNEAIAKMVGAANLLPPASALNAGQERLAYAGDIGTGDKTTLLGELTNLTNSELGYAYMRGDSTVGGTLVFEDRHSRIRAASSSASLNDTMTSFEVIRPQSRVANRVGVTVHPRDVDAAGTCPVVFSLTYVPTIPAGASLTVLGEYTDPAAADRKVGAASVLVPVAPDDYQVSYSPTGSADKLTFDQKGRVLATCPTHLLGYWTLGNTRGACVFSETDPLRVASGSYTGVTVGATGIGDGRTATCALLSVGGVNHVDLLTSATCKWASSPMDGTVSLWLKGDSASAWTTASNLWMFALRTEDGNQTIQFRKPSVEIAEIRSSVNHLTSVTLQTFPTANTDWYHFALAWSSVTRAASAYLNGVFNTGTPASTLGTSWTASSPSLRLYAIPNFNNFPGTYAHCAIWDVALAASHILGIYLSSSGGVNLDADIGGRAIRYSIVNQNPVPVYVTTLQARGRAVRDFQPTTHVAGDPQGVVSETNLDMPYKQSALDGQAAADFVLSVLGTPVTDVESVRFLANESDALMRTFLNGEPGSRIRLQETVSGIDADYYVNGVEYQVREDYSIECTWLVVPALNVAYWALGTAGYSEVGSTTTVTY